MFNKQQKSQQEIPQNLLNAGAQSAMPNSFKDYTIDYKSPLFATDDDVLERFYNAGFNNSQAQLVYDLANERILPYIQEMASEFEAQKQLEKLVQYFGSQEKFNEVSRQVSAWAKQQFEQEVYNALGSTSEGVIALYKMMGSNEPAINSEASFNEPVTDESLTKMMQDPRYWQTKDKDYIAKITNGFEKLYGNK
ncbi:MAG: hypothetical protein R3Y43_02920 [Alphaproteobacteria bacterium]